MATSIVKCMYPVAGPFMDAGRPPNRIEGGFFSRITGADGRFIGCVRPFPGMRRLCDISSIVNSVISPEEFVSCGELEYFQIQQGVEQAFVRGFVARVQRTVGNQERWDLFAVWYYDGAWNGSVVVEDVGEDTDFGVCSNGRWLYIAVEGDIPRVTWWDEVSESLASASDMGPPESAPSISGTETVQGTAAAGTSPSSLVCPGAFDTVYDEGAVLTITDSSTGESVLRYIASVVSQDQADLNESVSWLGEGDTFSFVRCAPVQRGGGELQEGRYLFCVQFSDSARPRYSKRSDWVSVNTIGDYRKVRLFIEHDDWMDEFDTLIVYRSLSVEVAGSVYDGGILYEERRITRDGDVWPTDTEGFIFEDSSESKYPEGGLKPDVYVVVQDWQDPRADETWTPPESGVIASYQATTFMAASAEDDGGRGRFVWSSLSRNWPESFPPDNISPGNSGDGPIRRFVCAGDVLWGFTGNSVWRIHKAGARATIARLHDGRGLASSRAAVPVGQDVQMLTRTGIAVLSGATGDMQLVSNLSLIIQDDWSSDLEDVFAAVDSALDAVFFVNPTRQDCIVIWNVTKTATLLEDCAWVGGTQGIDPVSGSLSRAFFVTQDGVVLYPDAEAVGERNMYGLSDNTLNGTVDSWNGATLTDNSAVFSDDVIGAVVYVLSGGTVHRRTVVARPSSTSLTLSSAIDGAGESDAYSIAPVVFRAVFQPVPAGRPFDAEFERKIVKGASVLAVSRTGVSENPMAYWLVSAYIDRSEEPVGTVAVPMDEDVADAAVSCHGRIVEPVLECYASGVGFELTAFQVAATMTVSRETD